VHLSLTTNRLRRLLWLLQVLVLAVFAPQSSALEIATPERVGPEFSLSEETAGYQQAPSVASIVPGQIVATWSGPASTRDDSPAVVWSGKFDRSGQLTANVRVMQKNWVSSNPAITGIKGHDWVALWTEYDAHDGSGEGIFRRHLDADLRPTNRFRQVNTDFVGRQIFPDVAMSPTGQYLAVWYDPGDFRKSDIKGRLFDASGSPGSDEFAIAVSTDGLALGPRIAALENRYVVTWSAQNAQGNSDVYFRFYDSVGNAGARVRANRPAIGSQSYPDVASCSDGRFIIVWGSSSRRKDADGGVYGQWFDSAGYAQGEQLHINTYTKDVQNLPTVATTPNCQAVVIWQSYGQDGDQEGVYGRILDASGTGASEEFRVNASTVGLQGWSAYRETAVVADANGSFFAAWTSIPDYSNPYTINPDVDGQWFCWLTDSPDRVCGNATCVGDPIGDETTASIRTNDALAVLRSAVGAARCTLCRCDVDGSGSMTSADALIVLRASLGLPVALNCHECPIS
jgi:hypothetical protein